MRNILLTFILLQSAAAFGQWTEPELFPVTHGNAIQGPWISNDNLRMYAAFSGYIFVSERVTTDSAWHPFHTVGNHVNGALRQESPCESPSGDTLYFMADGREPCFGSYDIYYTIRTDSGWFGPIFNCGPNINSPYREWSVGISRDGVKLLICSDRIPGGVLFLYYSDKLQDGAWSPLTSFGPNINDWVRFGETSHGTLSIDNRTLVFSGMGPRNGDIYISRYNDSTGWGLAAYVPEPVTTLQWRECDPCFGPDGRTLYFISDHDAHPFGTQLYVTEDTTVSATNPRPALPPLEIVPALFGQVRDENLYLTLVGKNRGGYYRIKIYDLIGRLVQASDIEMNNENNTLKGTLELDNLSSGTYLVALQQKQTHYSTRISVVR